MKTISILKQQVFTIIFISTLFILIGCSSSGNDTELEDMNDNTEVEENENSENDTFDTSPILSMFDNQDAVSYSIANGKVTISTTNLPNHESPYYLNTEWHNELYSNYSGTNSSFHMNPNRISQQNITFTISLSPEEATNKEQTPMGPIGIARNGVVLFNQYAAGRSTLDNEINSFDQYLGHPSGNGMYHYHIEPTYLTETYGEDAFIGLLSDGFPVYGPRENNQTISSEDLDDYHGHFSITKEFPNGIYHYHITADAPYLNGDGFYGTQGTVSR